MREIQKYQAVYLIPILMVLLICCNKQVKPKEENTIAPLVKSELTFSSRVGIIFQDSKNNYWFVSQKDGVCRYDGKHFTYFTEAQGLKQVRAIEEDKQGNIYLGIEDGLSIFDGKTFKTIYPEAKSVLITESFGFSDENFEEEWAKERQHFWFSAFNQNGVYRYDGEKLMHLTLPVPKEYPVFDETGHHPEHGWDIYAVYGIYKDNDENLWFGTPGGGLFRYNGKTIECITNQIVNGVVRAIYQDNKGTIWFGNNAKGIYQYNGKSLLSLIEQEGLKEMDLKSALDIEEDKDGNLWFGTFSSGLWRYKPSFDQRDETPLIFREEAWTHYTAKDGLGTNYISSVYKDNKGVLWIGTGEGRVFTFNEGTFVEF